MVMTLFLTPYSLLEPFFSLLSKKAYDPTEHGTYTYSGRLCNESVPFQHLEPKFETRGMVCVCFSCRCNECVITDYTVVNE